MVILDPILFKIYPSHQRRAVISKKTVRPKRAGLVTVPVGGCPAATLQPSKTCAEALPRRGLNLRSWGLWEVTGHFGGGHKDYCPNKKGLVYLFPLVVTHIKKMPSLDTQSAAPQPWIWKQPERWEIDFNCFISTWSKVSCYSGTNKVPHPIKCCLHILLGFNATKHTDYSYPYLISSHQDLS